MLTSKLTMNDLRVPIVRDTPEFTDISGLSTDKLLRIRHKRVLLDQAAYDPF